MKKTLAVLSVFIFALTLQTPVFAKHFDDLLEESVGYLTALPEVAWIKFDEKNVIIGWKGLPSLFAKINREAAINASKATGYPIQVWSVRHSQKKWRTGAKPFICKTMADRGKVLKSNCR